MKTKNINIKLDPKLRYGLELLTRTQRRSVSEVIRWVIQREFVSAFSCPSVIDFGTNVIGLLDHLYRENELERIKVLKEFDPMLLTIEEEKLIKSLNENE